MKIYPLILFLILFNSFSHSQNKQREFVEALINGNDSLDRYVDEDELGNSKRLRINYDGVKYKFIISFDIDEKVKNEINKNNLKYEIKESDLGNGYSKAEFTVTYLNYSKQFYFKNGKWISPISYFSKVWTTKTSKYFIFKISEPKYFNDYCINKLDDFVDSLALLLEFDEQQKQLLKKEKIYYVLCKDEKEIEQITGFNMRGQFITAMDGIITTYNTHYHELAHLLMNYKLKNLSLYTLPFFMEGFAVAVGGRGGMAKRVVLDIGYYLQKSGFLTYDSIITNVGFYKEDASMTYPVAGLYNAFLLKELGIEKYLQTYVKSNGSLNDVQKLKSNEFNLPNIAEFQNFLGSYENNPTIYFNIIDTNRSRIVLPSGEEINIQGMRGDFVKVDNYYKFSVRSSPFLFSPEDKGTFTNYISKKYKDISDDEDGIGSVPPKYGIVCDSINMSVYNFYTNEVIASFSTGFSINHDLIPSSQGRYSFFINENVFEHDLDSTFSIIDR